MTTPSLSPDIANAINHSRSLVFPAAPADETLTPRQEAFADAYAQNPNGAAAARDAGYARASAKVAASRNLRRSGVLLRIMARRREQAEARETQRTRVAELLDEALTFGREQRSANALARIAALMMRLHGLQSTPRGDDQILADATSEQLEEMLAVLEVTAGVADPELPDPRSASVEELADRALELMLLARDNARQMPGLAAADHYLKSLMDHLNRGVRDATEACMLARMVDDAEPAVG